MNTRDHTYTTYVKFLHAGLAVFVITAFLTGEIAEDGTASSGFYIHAYLGLSLALFIMVRIFSGFSGFSQACFSEWSPFSLAQWKLASDDIRSLIQLKVPERGSLEGLSGLTQAFGLIVFGWMGVTGVGLFLLREASQGALFEVIEELHEVGEALIPLFLALHIGAVLIHSLTGKPNWQRMWRFR